MMGHMKKYSCPHCQSTQAVIAYGRRKQVLRYFCKHCLHHFSVNPCYSPSKAVLNDHLDGMSFRKLGVKYRISPMTAWRLCEAELKKLPNNNQFTHRYCNQFGNTLVTDGKYFNVAHATHDWALLWGMDYFRHDIPIILVAPSESYQSWSKYFFYHRLLSHHPELLVCDDNANLKLAALRNFPQVKIQTCWNHFKENIRRDLKDKSETTYVPFMRRVEVVFKQKRADNDLDRKLFALYRDYQADPVAVSILTRIAKYRPELTAYRGWNSSPVTSNLMEGLNAHLEARLIALRSFQSPRYAKLWLNGYVLKRRFTKFTDCKGKFRRLNGKRGIDQTKKPEIDLPNLF